jgi:uncharacterized membrane protein
MPDPTAPGQPSSPPPIPAGGPTSDPSSLDLPPTVAAALACIPLVGGIIFYILEKRNGFVRFYAMQSIIFGGAWLLFYIVWRVILAILVPIPVVGWIIAVPLWIIWAVIHIAFLVIMIITIVKALTGARWEIPYIGPIARRQVEGSGVS